MFPSLLLSIGLLLLSATFCFSLDRTFRLGSEAKRKQEGEFISLSLNSRYPHNKEAPLHGGKLNVQSLFLRSHNMLLCSLSGMNNSNIIK